MRKIYLLFVLAILGLGATGCSSDDNKSEGDKQSLMQGAWVHASYGYLDANKKELETRPAGDNKGCGKDQLVIKGDTWVSTFYGGKVDGVCLSESGNGTFVIKGNVMVTYSKGDNGEVYEDVADIIEISASKMIMVYEEELTDGEIIVDKLPAETRFVKITFVRK